MKKRLILLGAGGFAGEVVEWCNDIPTENRDWDLWGLLVDSDELQGKEIYGLPVIGTIKDYAPTEEDVFLSAIGTPPHRLNLSRSIEERGGEFITLVHPSAIVGESSTLGIGTIICPNSVITANTILGKHCLINLSSNIGHDVVIGNGVVFCVNSDVTGWVKLGDNVFIGSQALVTPNIIVEDGAFIGAGSIVVRKVAANRKVFGNPAVYID